VPQDHEKACLDNCRSLRRRCISEKGYCGTLDVAGAEQVYSLQKRMAGFAA
jgi:hypothetical protein